MALLADNNPITADGTYTLNTDESKEYRIEASGTFGGGTLSLQTKRGLEMDSLTAAGGDIYSPGEDLQIVLSGATAPSITIDISTID